MNTTIRYIATIIIALIAIPETSFGQDEEPPSTPTGLTVIETHNEAIGINWNPSTDNVGVAGYRIYLDDLPIGNSVDNEYIVTGLSVSTTYTIEVSAFDASSNESARSTSVNPTTTTSSITGSVLWMGDPNTGATVLLTGQGLNLGSTVNSGGGYNFINLRVGMYELSVDANTYNVQVIDGHITIQDFILGDDIPIVHTSPVTNITETNAECGGTVSGTGIIVRGVVWSTSPNITALSQDTTDNGDISGAFSTDMRDLLTPNTVYYVKAYARNGNGTGFGEEYRFYTGCNPIILNEQITHNFNCGGNSGTISITHLELEAPYTYSWTGPNSYTANSKDIIDLISGDYEITVSDKNGCQTVKSYAVTEPLPYEITVANLTHVSCPECADGAIAITISGGNPGPSINWTGPGSYTGTTEDISNLYPGIYRVQVSDLFGCSAELEVEIGYPLVVTKTSDYDPFMDVPIIGTLRYAMEHANSNPGQDSISFNIVGDGPFTIYPTSDLPDVSGSVFIDGYSQNGTTYATATTPATLLIEVNGSLFSSEAIGGLILSGEDNTIRGLMINGFYHYAIYIPESRGNVIEGNHIGVDWTGEVLRENRRGCVLIEYGNNNLIGGDTPAQRNVMAGTEAPPEQVNSIITIRGGSSQENIIKGNYIGINAVGQAKLGTTEHGVLITASAHHNTIGPNNVISGLAENGIYIFGEQSHHNQIIGNYIGTNYIGTSVIPNEEDGILIYRAIDNIIGGDNPGERNIISGNTLYGLELYRANDNQVLGNFIGTDFNGSTSIPNGTGIYLEGSEGIVIGGPDPGNGNLISGNGVGILLNADGDFVTEGNIIQGNYIGTDLSGMNSIGNEIGIRFGDYSDNNLVGGIGPNLGNLIAYNSSGIVSDGSFNPSTENSYLSNSIHSNSDIGIDHNADLVTSNDESDGDTGPNDLQNFPELENVTFSQDEVTVVGSLNSSPDSYFILQYFVSPEANETGYGEGKRYIGSDSVNTDQFGDVSFTTSFPTSLRDGLVVTATATDPAGNTSEFSNAVGGAQDQVVSGANMPMHFVIHEEGIPYIADGSDFQALQQSFDTWEAISTSQVSFIYDGPTTQAEAVANDGINLITFMDESYFTTNEVLGVAAKTLYMDDASGTAEIVDADIIFNPYNTQGLGRFSTDTHTGDYDLQSIATHEIGHTFGMIHTGVLVSTMFYAVMENTTDKRTLEQDDISWASFRYPRSPDFGDIFGFISGNITYGDDPQFPPVGGALVLATNTLSGASIHAYSDENGDYMIPVPAGNYTVAIEPLDGNVQGYNLTQANISYYIDGITNYTDFPNEYYNAGSEGAEDDNPDEFVAVNVFVADTTGLINLVTNKDVTPPEVVAVAPKRDSTGVGVMTQIFMGFSEPVSIATFVDGTCYLTSNNGEVYGNFVVADNYGRRIAFTPKEYPLDYSLIYTLHITNGITDLKGNGLDVSDYTSQFTTEDPDLNAPIVTDMIPDHGNDTVFVNADVMVFFSEPMDVSSTPDGFSVRDESDVLVEGIYSWDQDFEILTFNPDSFLDEGMAYTVAVTTGMRDLSLNPLAKDTLLVFSTVPEAPPELLFVGPGPDQASVSLDSPLVLDFSEPINLLTTNANTIQILVNGTPLVGEFEFVYDNSRVVFRPVLLLAPNTTYEVVVSDQIYDMSDPSLSLEQGFSHQFITAETVIEPHIDYLTPSSGVAGTMVTIGGIGFDPNPDMNQVYFGDIQANIIANDPDYITTTVPVGAVAGMVHVEVDGRISNEQYFYVVPINENPGDEIRRTVGTRSQAEDVEIEPDAAYAYVTNSGANTITRLNMVTFQVQSLSVGQMPVQIEIHPNGDMAYVTNHLSHTVSVIDLDAMRVVQTIAVGINPYGVVVSPNGDMLYVANTTSEDVLYIDVDPYSGGYDRVVRGVNTSASNKGIDISPDAGLVLIACDEGILFLITDPDHIEYNQISRRVSTSSSASSVQILPDAGMGVAVTDDNYLVLIGIAPGTSYGKIVGRVNTRSSVSDIAISPDGQFIYATHTETDEVSVYEISYTGGPDASVIISASLELVNVIQVDEAPYAIAMDPRGDRVFVGHYTEDGQVTEIDISGAVDVISSLEELIESVNNAIDEKVISRKYGNKLLQFLDKTLDRYNSGQLNSARAQLDNFIKRVERWMRYGNIPEELGNAWLEAAYRIRAQLVQDLAAQSGLKSTQELGSGVRTMEDPPYISHRDLTGKQTLILNNQPNPFGDQTRINFEIPEIDRANIPVIMRVFNTNGQVVKTMIHRDMQSGSYSVIWNGSLDDGGLVPDGIYLLELMIPGQREVMTISVIR